MKKYAESQQSQCSAQGIMKCTISMAIENSGKSVVLLWYPEVTSKPLREVPAALLLDRHNIQAAEMGFAGHGRNWVAVLCEAWELSLQAVLFQSQLPCQKPQAESFVVPCSPATQETCQGGIGTATRVARAGIQRGQCPPCRSRATNSWSHLLP